MKLGILGTRGIPNQYGGFEQFAEYLSFGLTQRGHDVYVYNSHTHLYQSNTWKGVHIIHKYDPEQRFGTAGQFIYDLACILDSRSRAFDAILNLGYTSSSVWSRVFPKTSVVLTNMDGLEWKRSKYGRTTKRFLRYAEGLAVKHGDVLIADSLGIQNYLSSQYNASSTYIPYGANVFTQPDAALLKRYELNVYAYNLLIARLEPENNIEMILDGVKESNTRMPMLVIGNFGNKFGRSMKAKYANDHRIRFLGAIYENFAIDNLRHFSNLYFHGHSVGGTNPSLLEAMGCGALIAAHYNEFNNAILQKDAFYFSSVDEVKRLLDDTDLSAMRTQASANNIEKIRSTYSWEKITNHYENLILKSIENHEYEH